METSVMGNLSVEAWQQHCHCYHGNQFIHSTHLFYIASASGLLDIREGGVVYMQIEPLLFDLTVLRNTSAWGLRSLNTIDPLLTQE